jgi:predicted alpha-1,2-mannosidase
VHDFGHRTKYTSFSGWDVYRSQIPLVALLAPDVASDVVESLLADARQSGWLPRWSVANAHTDVMVGDPASPAIATTYALGARDFDRAAALAAMVKGGTDPGTPDATHVERQALADYVKYGYVPHDGTESSTGAQTSMFGSPLAVWGSAATTLEYTSADFAVAAFAAALGDSTTCETFLARSAGWAKLWNPVSGYIHPRYANGEFKPNLDPTSLEGFVEGNAAQYSWLVPHDVAGLASRMGGTAAAAQRLDEHFTQLNAGPQSVYAFLGNEPEALTAWLYDWLGRPERTQQVVRRALLEIFGSGPSGYPGNDDLGQMSAWWVFGALGLYPAIPGTDVLAIGSPLFPEATLEAGGRRIHIVAPDAARDRPYVKHLSVGGARHDRPWIRLTELGDDATLAFDLGDAPGTGWATDPASAPPSFGDPDAGAALCRGER